MYVCIMFVIVMLLGVGIVVENIYVLVKFVINRQLTFRQ